MIKNWKRKKGWIEFGEWERTLITLDRLVLEGGEEDKGRLEEEEPRLVSTMVDWEVLLGWVGIRRDWWEREKETQRSYVMFILLWWLGKVENDWVHVN